MGGGVPVVAKGEFFGEALLPQLSAEQRGTCGIHFPHKMADGRPQQLHRRDDDGPLPFLQLCRSVIGIVHRLAARSDLFRVKASAIVLIESIHQIAGASALEQQADGQAAVGAPELPALGIPVFLGIPVQADLIADGKAGTGRTDLVQHGLHGGDQLFFRQDLFAAVFRALQSTVQGTDIGNAQLQGLFRLGSELLFLRLSQAPGHADFPISIDANGAGSLFLLPVAVDFAAGDIQGHRAAAALQKLFFHRFHLTAHSFRIPGRRGRQSQQAGPSAPSCRSRR